MSSTYRFNPLRYLGGLLGVTILIMIVEYALVYAGGPKISSTATSIAAIALASSVEGQRFARLAGRVPESRELKILTWKMFGTIVAVHLCMVAIMVVAFQMEGVEFPFSLFAQPVVLALVAVYYLVTWWFARFLLRASARHKIAKLQQTEQGRK